MRILTSRDDGLRSCTTPVNVIPLNVKGAIDEQQRETTSNFGMSNIKRARNTKQGPRERKSETQRQKNHSHIVT